ncbi:MBL fold metallo-hydrolase [Nonlabens marinus]|uniref:Metal-dependent hydrolase n=1 Tax=Nonlabens marinus S1-08 TaxID=1454201 RepID=W8VMU5_9FLAO|nr:MBL fold metallo-hydrolase [Nonlabens marinus]BAO54059.1 metal-dependent hydrolase [Nonlabens marinus S1-08]
MKNLLWICLLTITALSCKEAETTVDQTETSEEEMINEEADNANVIPDIQIRPISHATFVMNWNDQIIYVDPVGGAAVFENMPDAEVILVTDIHGDHMNPETIAAVKNESNFLFVPQAVADKLDAKLRPTVIVNNGEAATRNGLRITAIPMYNITEGRLDKHPKGRGNGYVLEKDGYRIYISGDTEGIPEMRNLQNIDKAFVCMNLPYTMDVEQAADAVLEFAPKEVVPYHYRGQDKFSDIEKFKSLVNSENPDIEVTLLEWYPSRAK